MKRTFQIEIQIDTENVEEAKKKIALFGEKILGVKEIKQYRTTQQSRALYLFFRLLSEALNDAGFDMKKTIKKNIDISWTPESIKNYLWLPIMKAMTGKTSTAKMKRDEIDKIYDVLNKTIGERTGVFVSFPSIDNLTNIDYN